MSVNKFQEFISKFYSNTLVENNVSEKIMILSIFVDSTDKDLKKIYLNSAQKHNEKLIDDPYFYDAGFDLFLPKNEKEEKEGLGQGTRFFSSRKDIPDIPINKVDFKVKCCAKIYNRNSIYNKMIYTPFYTYARSSISKTPLRLANNQGIIDAGYRGPIIGMFDCISDFKCDVETEFDWYMEPYSRILQICAPSLMPIFIEIVDNFEDLGPSTSRGEGGIGSTGK
jgi:dUTP pyrophosphatase